MVFLLHLNKEERAKSYQFTLKSLSHTHSLSRSPVCVIWTSKVWKRARVIVQQLGAHTAWLQPGYADLNTPPFLHILCSSLFSSSVTNPPLPRLHIQSPSLFSSSTPDYLLLLTLCPYSQKTKQIQVEHPAFLPPVGSQAYPSQPVPLLSVSFQYLETHFTWKHQWPHILGSQKNFLPDNTQLAHSPKKQKRQQNQGTKHLSNKESKYEYLELHAS